jgi:DNA end-binding protein Ku
LRVREGVIVLETMLWPDEVRQPDFAFLDQPADLRPQERQMAESLVRSMAGDFDPDQYHDEYREALQKVIEAKVEGREVVEAPGAAVPDQANVVDLMAALRASVEAAKKSRGEAPAAESAKAAEEAKPAPKKAPAKTSAKAPAKKAASGAKTTAPKRPAAKAPAKSASNAPAKRPAKKAAASGRRSA